MYTQIRQGLPAFRFSRPKGQAGSRVTGVVILMGLTSLLTDISSEMVASILPLYLVLQLQLSPLYFGVIDGLYQLVSTPLRIVGGFLGDKLRRHKEVAASGYGLSAACKLGLASADNVWPGLTGFLLLDRAGKGIRTAPRDAVIAANSEPASLGLSFGVHRAMDTLGAMLGPIVAFLVLSASPGAYRSIFIISFLFAVVGFAVIVLFVDARSRPAEGPAEEASVAPEPPAPAFNFREALSVMARHRFWRLLIIASGLGLFTVSDGFLYLVLQRQLDFEAGFFPLLFVGTAAAYFLLAIPFGWLADRIGRGRVLVLGYVLLIATYTALLREPAGPLGIAMYLALFGAHYAATDGVLAAMASEHLPENMRGTGLAVLGSTTGLARFGGALMFGAAWAAWGSDVALAIVMTGLVVMTLLAFVILSGRTRTDVTA